MPHHHLTVQSTRAKSRADRRTDCARDCARDCDTAYRDRRGAQQGARGHPRDRRRNGNPSRGGDKGPGDQGGREGRAGARDRGYGGGGRGKSAGLQGRTVGRVGRGRYRRHWYDDVLVKCDEFRLT